MKGVQETIKRAQWFAAPGIYAMSELPEPKPNPALDCGMVVTRAEVVAISPLIGNTSVSATIWSQRSSWPSSAGEKTL